MTCEAARLIKRRGSTQMCTARAWWYADVRVGTITNTRIINRRLCDNHLSLYKECGIVKAYVPLREAATA